MRAKAGFTLLETMVALALLGLSVVAMLQLLSGVTDAAARVRAHADGLALAQSALDRLVASRAEEILHADATGGAFPAPFDRYRYSVMSARVAERSLIEIRVLVTWPEPGAGVVQLLTRTSLVPGTGQ